jgi:hypothetical protein
MNRIIFVVAIACIEYTTLAARYKPIDFGKVGDDIASTLTKAMIGVAAASIMAIGILGKLGIVDNPIQHIKEKYRLAAIALASGGLIALMAKWVS